MALIHHQFNTTPQFRNIGLLDDSPYIKSPQPFNITAELAGQDATFSQRWASFAGFRWNDSSFLAPVMPSHLNFQGFEQCFRLQGSYTFDPPRGPNQDQLVDIFRGAVPAIFQTATDVELLNYAAVIDSICPLGILLQEFALACNPMLVEFLLDMPLSSLNMTTNCTATVDMGYWMIENISSLGNVTVLLEQHQRFLYNTLQASVVNVSSSMFPSAILTWGYKLIKEEDFQTKLQTAIDYCLLPVCRARGIQGNPDIAGIGVLITFFIQVMLVTVFDVCSVFYGKSWKMVQPSTNPPHDHIKLALLKSLDAVLPNLLGTSFFLSLSITIAGISYSRGIQTQYEVLAIAVSRAQSLSATTGLFLVAWQRRHFDLTSILLYFCPFAAMTTILPVSAFNALRPISDFDDFICYNRRPNLRSAILISIVIIPLTCMFVLIFVVAHTKRTGQRQRGPFASKIGLSLLVFLYIVMIINYGMFVMIRMQAKNSFGSGYGDNAWGFGQIVGILLWLPATYDFLGSFAKHFLTPQRDFDEELSTLEQVRRVHTMSTITEGRSQPEPLGSNETSQPDSFPLRRKWTRPLASTVTRSLTQ